MIAFVTKTFTINIVIFVNHHRSGNHPNLMIHLSFESFIVNQSGEVVESPPSDFKDDFKDAFIALVSRKLPDNVDGLKVCLTAQWPCTKLDHILQGLYDLKRKRWGLIECIDKFIL